MYKTSADDKRAKKTTDRLYETMLNRQYHNQYIPDAPWQKYRRPLVDFIRQTCGYDHFDFVPEVSFVAVRLMDRYLNQVDLRLLGVKTERDKDRIVLLALACIWIAAKFTGNKASVPQARNLIRHCKDNAQLSYTQQELCALELQVLTELKGEVRMTTATDFCLFFLANYVIENDELVANCRITKLELMQNMKKDAIFFLHLCLRYYPFEQYRPQVLACAVLLNCQIEQLKTFREYWSCSLVSLTHLRLSDFGGCAKEINKYYHSNFPGHCKVTQRDDIMSSLLKEQHTGGNQAQANMSNAITAALRSTATPVSGGDSKTKATPTLEDSEAPGALVGMSITNTMIGRQETPALRKPELTSAP